MAGASLLALVKATPAAAVDDYRVRVTIANADRSAEREILIECSGPNRCYEDPIEIPSEEGTRPVQVGALMAWPGVISVVAQAVGPDVRNWVRGGRTERELSSRTGQQIEWTINRYGPREEDQAFGPHVPIFHLRATVE